MLNALGTLFVILGVSLVTALSLFWLVIWIMLLVDSFKRNKIIWFIFMLLSPLLVSILYVLIEKPKVIYKNINQLRKTALLILCISLVIGGVPFVLLSRKASSPPALEQFTGTIIEQDLGPRAVGGTGFYKVKDEAGNVETISIPSNFSACDMHGMTAPDTKVGDRVLISAKPDGNGQLTICDSDTYIQKQ